MRRRVEHRAVIVHRRLLNLQPEVIDDTLDFQAPRTDVLGRHLPSSDTGVTFVGDRIDADQLEVRETLGDVSGVVGVGGFQGVEAAGDVVGNGRGVRGLKIVKAGVDGGRAGRTIPLRINETLLPAHLRVLKRRVNSSSTSLMLRSIACRARFWRV